MNKFFVFFGLSLLTAMPPSTILGHGNEEHPGGLFAKLKDAVFGSYGDQQPFGRVGMSSEVSRNVAINMSDQFRFDPETITVGLGETLRLSFQNTGQQTHDWIFGTAFEISEYMEMMRRSPDREQNEPQNIQLKPGEEHELVWQFNKQGNFEYACLQPGHYEAGMRGTLAVQ